jgi:phage/plasmid-associated DNA primase
MAPNHEH